jgi:AraC-like DNA-binding protein
MSRPSKSLIERSTLAAWLTHRESVIVAAHLTGHVTLRVVELPMLAETLTAGRAHAVLVSAARLDADTIERLVRLRRIMPRVPLLVLVTQEAAGMAWRLPVMGRLRPDAVADVTIESGWRTLYEALDHLPSPLVQRAINAVSEALGGEGTEGWFRFMKTVFQCEYGTVTEMAQACGVPLRRFDDRFRAARLPEPKRYLEIGTLARVAYLSELTSWGIVAIAHAVNASSPQALHSRIQRLTGMSPLRWRREHGATWVLDEMCRRYVRPYHAVLQTFDPYARRWQSRRVPLARESILWGQCNDHVSGSAVGP